MLRPDEAPFSPLPAHPSAGSGNVFHCALCGNSFTHSGLVCGTCPMQTACALVKCPNCGYQFPRSSAVVDFFRRMLFRLRRR